MVSHSLTVRIQFSVNKDFELVFSKQLQMKRGVPRVSPVDRTLVVNLTAAVIYTSRSLMSEFQHLLNILIKRKNDSELVMGIQFNISCIL